jgi:hypothetical protein
VFCGLDVGKARPLITPASWTRPGSGCTTSRCPTTRPRALGDAVDARDAHVAGGLRGRGLRPLSIDREKPDPIRTEATVIGGEVVFEGL